MSELAAGARGGGDARRLALLRFEVAGGAGGGVTAVWLAPPRGTTTLVEGAPGAVARVWRRRVADRLDAIVLDRPHGERMLRADRRGGRPIALHVPADGADDVLAALGAALGDELAGSFDPRTYAPSAALHIGDLAVTFDAAPRGCPAVAARVSDGRATILLAVRDGLPVTTLEATPYGDRGAGGPGAGSSRSEPAARVAVAVEGIAIDLAA